MRAAFEILLIIFAMLQSVVQDLPKENIKFVNTKFNVDVTLHEAVEYLTNLASTSYNMCIQYVNPCQL